MHNPAGVSIATEEAISKADIFYHLLASSSFRDT
jgi:hypothetical protein